MDKYFQAHRRFLSGWISVVEKNPITEFDDNEFLPFLSKRCSKTNNHLRTISWHLKIYNTEIFIAILVWKNSEFQEVFARLRRKYLLQFNDVIAFKRLKLNSAKYSS